MKTKKRENVALLSYNETYENAQTAQQYFRQCIHLYAGSSLDPFDCQVH